MVVDVTVRGVDDLERVARRFRAAARTGAQGALLQRIRAAVDETRPTFRASALSTLPSGGGLAARIAGLHIATRVRASGQNVEARVEAPGRGLDEGRLTHPVFGHRDRWVRQAVPPGWFSDPAEDSQPRVRAAAIKATTDVAHEIERGI